MCSSIFTFCCLILFKLFSISLKPKYVDKSPFPTIQVFNTFFPSPNLFKRTGGLARKFSSLTIKETKDIKSPPTLPTKAIIEPIAKDNIISIAKTFHNIWLANLNIHRQKPQSIHAFPENIQINNIKTARHIFINPNIPKIRFTVIFPFLSE